MAIHECKFRAVHLSRLKKHSLSPQRAIHEYERTVTFPGAALVEMCSVQEMQECNYEESEVLKLQN